ncbi:MAG TPA: sulfate adenylyltransferase, partial [Thermoanaerobaculia bacterium]|nr:sulfate adenylyltransferase [Thermoanaerobaculia bacterium]
NEMTTQTINIDSRNLSDLWLLTNGGFDPVRGFHDFDDARSIVERLETVDGTTWPIPILLQLEAPRAAKLEIGSVATLRHGGRDVGTIRIDNRYRIPLRDWARKIYKTDEPAHPGVEAFYRGGEIAVAGPVEWLAEVPAHELGLTGLTPAQTREAIALRGWKSVVAFQTRNPIHRAHEYILRTALEMIDGLLLHPLVGDTRGEDVPAEVRLRCYDALIDHYLPRERVLFTTFHGWMRYGGPREAVLHAIVRRNFGATHFLVGRDHAGVDGYYGPYDAQELLRSIGVERLGITPLYFDNIFHCTKCGSMASSRTCAHEPESRLSLSGTEVRRRLHDGEPLPAEITRPEVAAVLREAFARPEVLRA